MNEYRKAKRLSVLDRETLPPLASGTVNNTNHETQSNADPSNLFSFDGWLRGRGLTRTTGYRYRRQGLIETTNIFGRLYVTRQQIEQFERRAIAGEFHKAAHTPARRERELAAA